MAVELGRFTGAEEDLAVRADSGVDVAEELDGALVGEVSHRAPEPHDAQILVRVQGAHLLQPLQVLALHHLNTLGGDPLFHQIRARLLQKRRRHINAYIPAPASVPNARVVTPCAKQLQPGSRARQWLRPCLTCREAPARRTRRSGTCEQCRTRAPRSRCPPELRHKSRGRAP
jgi:hypothetical protein